MAAHFPRLTDSDCSVHFEEDPDPELDGEFEPKVKEEGGGPRALMIVGPGLNTDCRGGASGGTLVSC